MLSLKPRIVSASRSRSAPMKRAGAAADVADGVGHAGADVERHHDFQRGVLVGDVRQPLRHPVFLQAEVLGFEVLHEGALGVADQDADLHHVDVDRFGDGGAAGADARHRPAAAGQLRDGADDVLADAWPGVPRTGVRRPIDAADEAPVGEEADPLDGGAGRVHDCGQDDAAGDVGVVVRRREADHRRARRRATAPPARWRSAARSSPPARRSPSLAGLPLAHGTQRPVGRQRGDIVLEARLRHRADAERRRPASRRRAGPARDRPGRGSPPTGCRARATPAVCAPPGTRRRAGSGRRRWSRGRPARRARPPLPSRGGGAHGWPARRSRRGARCPTCRARRGRRASADRRPRPARSATGCWAGWRRRASTPRPAPRGARRSAPRQRRGRGRRRAPPQAASRRRPASTSASTRSREASVRFRVGISATVRAKATRSAAGRVGAGGSSLTRRSACTASATSSPSRLPSRCQGMPGTGRCLGEPPRPPVDRAPRTARSRAASRPGWPAARDPLPAVPRRRSGRSGRRRAPPDRRAAPGRSRAGPARPARARCARGSPPGGRRRNAGPPIRPARAGPGTARPAPPPASRRRVSVGASGAQASARAPSSHARTPPGPSASTRSASAVRRPAAVTASKLPARAARSTSARDAWTRRIATASSRTAGRASRAWSRAATALSRTPIRSSESASAGAAANRSSTARVAGSGPSRRPPHREQRQLEAIAHPGVVAGEDAIEDPGGVDLRRPPERAGPRRRLRQQERAIGTRVELQQQAGRVDQRAPQRPILDPPLRVHAGEHVGEAAQAIEGALALEDVTLRTGLEAGDGVVEPGDAAGPQPEQRVDERLGVGR